MGFRIWGFGAFLSLEGDVHVTCRRISVVLFIMNKLFQVDFKFITIDSVQIGNGKVY